MWDFSLHGHRWRKSCSPQRKMNQSDLELLEKSSYKSDSTTYDGGRNFACHQGCLLYRNDALIAGSRTEFQIRLTDNAQHRHRIRQVLAITPQEKWTKLTVAQATANMGWPPEQAHELMFLSGQRSTVKPKAIRYGDLCDGKSEQRLQTRVFQQSFTELVPERCNAVQQTGTRNMAFSLDIYQKLNYVLSSVCLTEFRNDK